MKTLITSAALVLATVFAAQATDPMKSVHNYKQMGASNKAKQEMRLAGTQQVKTVNRKALNNDTYKNNFVKYDYSYEMVPTQKGNTATTTVVKKNYKHQF